MTDEFFQALVVSDDGKGVYKEVLSPSFDRNGYGTKLTNIGG